MYRVPSEFIRQKNTVIGPITVAHFAGGFGGFTLGQALGDRAWLTALCVLVGLALTTLKVKGLVLYQFLPLAFGYLVRKISNDLLEPEEPPAVAAPTGMMLLDENGVPILLQERE